MLDWAPVGQTVLFYYPEVAELLLFLVYITQNYTIDVGTYGRWFIIKLVVTVLACCSVVIKIGNHLWHSTIKDLLRTGC